jgi:hypothetical protein
MRTLRAGLATATVAAAVAAPAHAAGPWVAPETLAPNGGYEPQVAMNDAGNALAVWTGPDAGIHIAQARPVSSFGAERRVADGRNPHVVMAPEGTAVLAWQGAEGGLVTATVSPAGELSPPQRLVPATTYAVLPREAGLAVGADGTAVVVWREDDPSSPPIDPNTGIVRAAFRPPGGSFGAPLILTDAQYSSDPRVSVDGQGQATVVWVSDDPPPNEEWKPHRAWVAQGDATSGFAPPEGLSAPDGERSGTDIGIDGNARGDLVVAWGAPGYPPAPMAIRARAAGESEWGPIQSVATLTNSVQYPKVAVDPAGNSAVVWRDALDGSPPFTYRPAGGAFGAPVKAAAEVPGYGGESSLEIDSRGRVVTIWGDDPGTSGPAQGPIQTTRFSPGRGFEPLSNIAGPAGSRSLRPDIALDAAGNGAVVWEGGDEPEDDEPYPSPGDEPPRTRPIKVAFYDTASPDGQYLEESVEQYLESGGVRGRVVKYRLSESARVTLKIQRVRACRGRKKCVAYETVRSAKDRGRRGTNRLTLPKKVAKAKGSYRAVLSASDRAGNRRAKSLRVRVR